MACGSYRVLYGEDCAVQYLQLLEDVLVEGLECDGKEVLVTGCRHQRRMT